MKTAATFLSCAIAAVFGLASQALAQDAVCECPRPAGDVSTECVMPFVNMPTPAQLCEMWCCEQQRTSPDRDRAPVISTPQPRSRRQVSQPPLRPWREPRVQAPTRAAEPGYTGALIRRVPSGSTASAPAPSALIRRQQRVAPSGVDLRTPGQRDADEIIARHGIPLDPDAPYTGALITRRRQATTQVVAPPAPTPQPAPVQVVPPPAPRQLPPPPPQMVAPPMVGGQLYSTLDAPPPGVRAEECLRITNGADPANPHHGIWRRDNNVLIFDHGVEITIGGMPVVWQSQVVMVNGQPFASPPGRFVLPPGHTVYIDVYRSAPHLVGQEATALGGLFRIAPSAGMLFPAGSTSPSRIRVEPGEYYVSRRGLHR